MSIARTIATCVALSLAGAALSLQAAAAPARTRRFALIAASNAGGGERAELRFAKSDAQAFARVLEELGGVSRADRLLVLDATLAELEAAMVRLEEKLSVARAPDTRLEVLVYYSGHSDDEGLLLGEQRLAYGSLRKYLERLPAEVRIAVLDSCASGAMTRNKGGKRQPPFLVDGSTSVRGHAFLTSSSASEAAQESDRIEGSFFTHYLVSGLRGAADASRDGKVTLTEAYQFAFKETLARTENTQSGPQHPNYDINLAGSGDLVMTDLRGTAAGLLLADSLAGRVFVRDAKGHLVVEVAKEGGQPVELGLEPGHYEVTVLSEGQVLRGNLAVARGEPTRLSELDLVGSAIELADARGTAPAVKRTVEQGYRVVPFSFTFVPPLSTFQGREKTIKRVSLNAVLGRADKLSGFEAGGVLNITAEEVRGAQFAGVGNSDRGTMHAIQGAGVFNQARKGGRGVQAAGAANLAGPGFTGLQVSGGINWAGGDAHVAQGSGAGNMIVGAGSGIQAAGAFNYVGGFMRGTQLSGGINIAGDLRGFQAGVVNISGDLNGAQVGVLNIAGGSVNGSQLGLLNISGSYVRGTPVGLLSIAKNGQYHVDVWASDATLANVGLKIGGQHLYTILAVGGRPARQEDALALTTGLGFGGTIRLSDSLFLGVDGIQSVVSVVENLDGEHPSFDSERHHDSLTQLRLMLGFKLFEHLGVFAGAQLNSYVTFSEGRGSPLPMGPARLIVRSGDTTARLWPGVLAGLQL